MCFLLAACGDGGGPDGMNAEGDASPSAADAQSDPDLVDRAGCHMTPFTVPPHETPTAACIIIQNGSCAAGNDRTLECHGNAERLVFEWEKGVYYNVKTFGWIPVESTHGELTTQTNADGAILGVPEGTLVEAEFQHVDGGSGAWLVGFRMEGDYVYFDYIIQRLTAADTDSPADP